MDGFGRLYLVNDADRVLAKDHLQELHKLLELALGDGRPASFLELLRHRIADAEREIASSRP